MDANEFRRLKSESAITIDQQCGGQVEHFLILFLPADQTQTIIPCFQQRPKASTLSNGFERNNIVGAAGARETQECITEHRNLYNLMFTDMNWPVCRIQLFLSSKVYDLWLLT